MLEETLKVYEKLISSNPNFERKGKTVPYTSANGYMFSFINKAGELGMRLPKETQKEFTEKYNSGPFHSHGSVMKDYVIIPKKLYKKTKLLSSTIQLSFEFVMSLKPK